MASVLRTKTATPEDNAPDLQTIEKRLDSEFFAALSWLLPAPTVKQGGRIETLQESLHPVEAPFVRNAVERRVLEFTAGRACARAVLKELDVHDFPVRMGARRQPLWPTGITGSISHAAGYCIAAAGTRDRLAGLGVDLESAGPLADSLIDLVCTPPERNWCRSQPDQLAGLLAKFMFSAKEAVFKCLFPVFGEELDFEDVSLQLDVHGGSFVARVSHAALAIGGDLELHGRLACTSCLVMTSALLEPQVFESLSVITPAELLEDATPPFAHCWN